MWVYPALYVVQNREQPAGYDAYEAKAEDLRASVQGYLAFLEGKQLIW